MKHEFKVPNGCKVNFTCENGVAIVEIEEEKQEFKENDIITCERNENKWIAIYKSKKDNSSFYGKIVYSIADHYFSKIEDYANFGDLCRLATGEETQILFDKLKEKCLMFDGKNVVRWRAEKGKCYYYVGSSHYEIIVESDLGYDHNNYNTGNYFPTQELAEQFQKQYIELLNNFHKNL